MKLYTVKQVKKLFRDYTFLRNDTINGICKTLQPIELPSDEEIEKFAQIASSIREEKTQGEWIAYKSVIAGAKWVINQIKQQDNGRN
jgi:hypothetical protein